MTKGDAGDRAKHGKVMEAWADYLARAEAREDRDPLAIFRSLGPEDIETVMRRLGVFERRSIKIKGGKRFLRTALSDGLGLFHRPSEVTAVLRRFEELGLTDLLNPPPKPEYEDDAFFGQVPKLKWEGADSSGRICAAIGAKAASIETFGEDYPPSWHQFGEPEAEAWFLTLFAFFYRRQNTTYIDIDERLKWAHALGRLMQWRQFWREGHDARSVIRVGSDRGWEKVRAKGEKENKRRAAMRSRWEEWARQRAQTLKSENPRLPRKQLSGLIYAETESREAQILIEQWRHYYNERWPHSALG